MCSVLQVEMVWTSCLVGCIRQLVYSPKINPMLSATKVNTVWLNNQSVFDSYLSTTKKLATHYPMIGSKKHKTL